MTISDLKKAVDDFENVEKIYGDTAADALYWVRKLSTNIQPMTKALERGDYNKATREFAIARERLTRLGESLQTLTS